MTSVAIYVALAEELTYAIDEMEQHGRFAGDPRTELSRGQSKFNYSLYDFPSNRIEVSLIQGMGNVICAAHVGTSFSQKMHAGPELALLVGISGSLQKDVGLGEVIVSNLVKYYSPDKIEKIDTSHVRIDSQMRSSHMAKGKGAGPFASLAGRKAVDDRDVVHGDNAIRFLRDEIFHVDNDNTGALFVQAANDHQKKLPFKLSRGALLGSNWVVDSDTYTNYLLHKNDWTEFDYYSLNNPAEYASRCKWGDDTLLAVDMESYGFLKAVAQFSRNVTNVKAYAVRGVSDLCSGKSALDQTNKSKNRLEATRNAVYSALLLSKFHFSNRTYSYRI